MSRDWDESEHPRHPSGTPGGRGGEFRDKTGGWVTAVATAIRSPEQDFLDLIQRAGAVASTDLSGGNSATTRRVTLEDRDGTRHETVVKNYGFISPEVMAAREVVVAAIARAVGAQVPTTVLDPGDPATLHMEFVPGESAYEHAVRLYDGVYDELAKFTLTPSGRRLGLLDLMTDQKDRHAGNWMITPDGSVVGIDHTHVDLGGDPDEDPDQPFFRYSTFTMSYMDSDLFLKPIDDLPPAEAARIRQRLVTLFEREDIRRLLMVVHGRFGSMRLAQPYVDVLLARWDAIAAMVQGEVG